MPDRQRIQKLVEALRSGQYDQGTDMLGRHNPVTDKDEFCCLGVACEVAMADTSSLVGTSLARRFVPRVTHTGNDVSCEEVYEYYQKDDESRPGSASFLPRVVMDYYGFDSDNPALRILPADFLTSLDPDYREFEDHGQSLLQDSSSCNDMIKLPFTTIADAFERTYLYPLNVQDTENTKDTDVENS